MTKWCDYLVFTKAYPFIIGLIFSQTLADNTLVTVLVTYLTEEWNQCLPVAAAAIVNLREFFTEICKVYVAYISDEIFGRFAAVLWLSGSYNLGLFILWVLEVHNTCNIKMLYLAVFFISLGKAGEESLKSFIGDQFRGNDPSKKVDEKLIDRRIEVWHGLPWILATGIALFLNASFEAYSIILTIILATELFGFWLGKPLNAYKFIQTKSAWKMIYHVGKAALFKRRLPYPMSPRGFYENAKDHNPLMPNIRFFRWLDKAAMVEHSRNLNVQEQVDMKILFTVSEVEEVKYISKIVSSSLTLPMYSIVEAMGTTLFFMQAKEINKEFSVIRFHMIKIVTSYCASTLWSNRREKLLRLKILTGMVCGSLCPWIAWMVENYNKRVSEQSHVTMKNVLEQSHGTISIWWLIPQFVFLGLMEGLAKDGIEGTFKDKVSESMGVSGSGLVQFMIGIGRFVSFLFMRKLSTRGNDTNRFGSSYYRLIGVASLVHGSIVGPILYTSLNELPIVVPTTPTSPRTPTEGNYNKKDDNDSDGDGPSIGCKHSKDSCNGNNTSPTEGNYNKKDDNASDGDGPSIGRKHSKDSCNGNNTSPPVIVDFPTRIPDWNCISSIEVTSSNNSSCLCGCGCDSYNYGPPMSCNTWVPTRI